MKRSKAIGSAALILVCLFVSCAYAWTQMDASFKKNQSDMAKGNAYSAQQGASYEAGLAVYNKNIALEEKDDVPLEQQSGTYWILGNNYLEMGDTHMSLGWAHEDAADSLYAGGMNYWGAGNAYYSGWNWDLAYEAYDNSLGYFYSAEDKYLDARVEFNSAKLDYAGAYDSFEMISDD